MKLLEALKRVLSEQLDIQHTGDSTINGGWQSDSNYTHFKVTHPNGEVHYVSYDHDEDAVLRHRKDPTRKDEGGVGGRSTLNYTPTNHHPVEMENMKNRIRQEITPRTRVKMIK